MRKRLMCLLLILMLSLGGCASQEPAPQTPLRVGYCKVDITPELGSNISGYGDDATRLAESVKDEIYATCIAMTYENETVLLYTVDNICMGAVYAGVLRPILTEKVGVAGDHIFFGATHSHNCPTINDSYKPQLTEAIVKAAEEAMADRAPAAILAAKPSFPGMNFVRHYEMSDGTYSGSNFGIPDRSQAIGHAAETDPDGVLIKFDRGQGKKDILLINWQAHPDSSSDIGYTGISPSWVGPLRDRVEQRSKMHVAYFTGASGNQNIDSWISSESHGYGWKTYGKKMGTLVDQALEQLQPVEVDGIQARLVVVDAEVDHSWDPMLGQANAVYDLWKTEGKEAGDRLGEIYGFTSSYQARAIRTRAELGPTRPLELGVIRIGDVAFVSGTYEMFSEQGMYIKENSPFETTFIITGNNGYVPSEKAYDYRSYEADTSLFAKGTAEKLAVRYVELLEELK